MNQRNFSLLIIVLLSHSLGLHAHVDLVKKAGGPVLLISSFDVAQKPINFNFEKQSTKIAKNLCQSIKKKLVSFTTSGLGPTTFDEQVGIYEALSAVCFDGRISFQKSIYPFVPYSNADYTLYVQQGSFIAAGACLTCGGLTSFLLAMGIDGQGDPGLAQTTGVSSLASSLFFLANGASIWLYRKYLNSGEGSELLPMNGKKNRNFAQPILADSIICE